MSEKTISERIRNQSAANEAVRQFQENSYYESLLRLRTDNPKTFQTLSRALQSAVEFYEKRKQKAMLLKETG